MPILMKPIIVKEARLTPGALDVTDPKSLDGNKCKEDDNQL